MLLFGLRSSSIALAGIVLAACGSAESAATQSPASQPAQSVAKSASAPSADAPIATASRGVAPSAYYECYFHGDYGLQNSSIISLRIHGPAEYEAMEERGRYSETDGTLRMETGTPGRARGPRAREQRQARHCLYPQGKRGWRQAHHRHQ